MDSKPPKETEMQKFERIMGRALRSMFKCPGTQEDIDARTEYIKYKIEERESGKRKKEARSKTKAD